MVTFVIEIESALTTAQIHEPRWQVELFFKWIKQRLRIKAFYGVSENVVKTQISIPAYSGTTEDSFDLI